MSPISNRARPVSRAAMIFALALGTAGGALAVAAPAAAQAAAAKEKAPVYSAPFRKAAGPVQNALIAAQKTTPDAAGIAALKAQVDGLAAVSTTPDDKFFAGQFMFQASQLDKDAVLQRKGLQTMVDSGRLTGLELGRYQYFLGVSAYQVKDYAAAQTSFAAAVATGYTENDVQMMLAESQFSAGQNDAGYASLMKAIVARNATATKTPQDWYARGLGVAYKAKQYDKALEFSNAMVAAYPTKDNWGDTINIARMAGRFQAQETLDLMRLMGRTNSFRDTSDYAEYLQAADARRSPGEVLKVLQAGAEAGKLNASDLFVTENKSVANARLAADKAGLPALERDARAPTSTAATINAAADAFLSYDDAAKAEGLYQAALAKGVADSDRALTRLGIAQLDQGKFADAQATFAKVGGVRKPIAMLWSTYAAQKAKGG